MCSVYCEGTGSLDFGRPPGENWTRPGFEGFGTGFSPFAVKQTRVK